MIGKAPRECITSAHRLAEREHRERARMPDAGRQQQAGCCFGDQREAHERRGELRILGKQDVVAMQQHRRTDADGAPLHGGHDRLRRS